jgi:hypothetical protein
VISLVVVLAIGGILVYKGFTRGRTGTANSAAGKEAAFQISLGGENAASGNNAAKSSEDGTTVGAYLESLSELNKVAVNQNGVFIFVPRKTDEGASDLTRNALLSAQKTLDSKNIKVGLYTLKTASTDYSAVSFRAQLPAVLVACKGGRMGIVSGEVSENKLLQAFTAASRAGGGCCAGGSKAGCK